MKLAALVALLSSYGIGQVLATSPGVGVPGYAMVDLTWKVETSPGGPAVLLNGTVEQVREQLLEISPDYEQQRAQASTLRLAPPAYKSRNPFSPRPHVRKDEETCNISTWLAGRSNIKLGIDYLRQFSGQATNGPGPGACARVSCSWKSAIFWCNDNLEPKSVDWKDIADGAQSILDFCPGTEISGEIFYLDQWQIVIMGDDC